jgi:glycosyltransferase involved in cell wall biosynthesis
LKLEGRGLRLLRQELRQFRPEVVSVWNLWSLSSALLAALRSGPSPLCMHLDDDWLLREDFWFSRWKVYNQAWMRIVKRLVRPWIDHRAARCPTDEAARQCVFISRFRRDQYVAAGWPVAAAEVIYGGIPDLFLAPPAEKAPDRAGLSRLLFVGLVTPDKAPHLAIEAMAQLQARGVRHLTLTLVGSSEHHPAYLAELKRLVQHHGLTDRVSFAGVVERAALPSLYRAHDLFLFTSAAAEGFPLTILEAMGSGLPVIASLSGGQNELIEDGVNALGFKPGDVPALVSHIERLAGDPALAHRIARAGQALIRERFTTDHMVQRHEELFLKAIARLGRKPQ